MKYVLASVALLGICAGLALADDVPKEVPPAQVPALPESVKPVDESADLDTVADMREKYQKQYPVLPVLRNCTPQEVQGLWVQQGVVEEPRAEAWNNYVNGGPEQIWFGTYNRYVSQRMLKRLDEYAMAKLAEPNLQQYIVSVKGMLYVYENYALKNAMLCFMASNANDKFKEGTLFLAAPFAPDKPLTASYYMPVAPSMEKR